MSSNPDDTQPLDSAQEKIIKELTEWAYEREANYRMDTVAAIVERAFRAGVEDGRKGAAQKERDECIAEAEVFHRLGALWPHTEHSTPRKVQEALRFHYSSAGRGEKEP